MPDPTPDDPEPIRMPDVKEEFEIADVADFGIAIPDSPQPVETGPLFVVGDVQAPVLLADMQPRYTEIARKSRIQGMVILQTIIDREGRITNVKVLKGLPMGLTDAAVAAVEQRRYEPATLNGRPVAVILTLTVNFQLQ
jgi:protein TonB